MFRGPPVPITGFAAATSGVLKMKPNEVGSDGSTRPCVLGFAKCGWFSMLTTNLPAQLHTYPLVQIGRLDNGEVQIVQPRAAERIPADVPKCAKRRWREDRGSRHITSQAGKLVLRPLAPGHRKTSIRRGIRSSDDMP